MGTYKYAYIQSGETMRNTWAIFMYVYAWHSGEPTQRPLFYYVLQSSLWKKKEKNPFAGLKDIRGTRLLGPSENEEAVKKIYILYTKILQS